MIASIAFVASCFLLRPILSVATATEDDVIAVVKKPSEAVHMQRNLQEETNKAIVKTLVEAIFIDFDVETADAVLGPNYIQHNPFAPNGRETVLNGITVFEAAGASAKIHRFIAYEDLVVVHSTFRDVPNFFGAAGVTFAMDMFRVVDGKVDEHWDCLEQRAEAKRNASGRTPTNGNKKVKAKGEEASAFNRNWAVGLVQEFTEGNWEAIRTYANPKKYKEHSMGRSDGSDGFLDWIRDVAIPNGLSYDEIMFVVSDGNFVVVASEGKWNGITRAFFDLYRVKNQLIVEHWSVEQDIPPEEEFVHNNGFWGEGNFS